MKRFININPKCDTCQGELVVTNIQVDLPNCAYILQLECIVCGSDQYLILSLEDFIDINHLLDEPEE